MPAHDEIWYAGESVLLANGRARKLGLLATRLRQAAAEPIDLNELTILLEQEFGRPADGSAADLTAAAVQELADLGLMEWLAPSE